MKRLLDSSWQRIGLQVALLAGIGLAFAIGSHEPTVRAEWGPDCPDEGACTFEKPNVMFIVDYSTSMNMVWEFNQSRWDFVASAIESITAPGTYLSQNTHLALMRFGHDPQPAAVGTTIPNDSSGLVDGRKLDVPWYEGNGWLDCNGSAIASELGIAGPPLGGGTFDGIETWTKGALDHAATLIAQAKADHPEDMDQRAYLTVLVTDSVWTGVDGTTDLAPANQNPAITAGNLFDNQNVPTWVIAVGGDAQAEQAADQLAVAGGTGASVHADTPALLEQGLESLVQQIVDGVAVPECSVGTTRIMVLLDASSSMLNINMGTEYGGMGATGWDMARAALAGDVDALFDLEVGGVGSVGDAFHLGLAVFGHNAPAPGEQKILVEYGPCAKDNFAWALDPLTSCEMPGCDDPWGGPPITWTFADGQQDPPGFDLPTVSHMPQCTGANPYCMGSSTYTHLGLQQVRTHQATYLAAAQLPNAPFPADAQTPFINILITDGQYTGYSTNAQVQTELEQMYADGITTHVIGFGDGVNSMTAIAQLETMADWGSGSTLDYHDANNQADLEARLAEIVGGLSFDPCCVAHDCSACPEPEQGVPCPIDFDSGGNEKPDPVPNDDADTTESTTESTTDESATDESTTEGTTGETASTGDSASESEGEGTTAGSTAGEDEIGDGPTGDAGLDDAAPTEGCNCASEPSERGPAGMILLLGLAGWVRRRSPLHR